MQFGRYGRGQTNTHTDRHAAHHNTPRSPSGGGVKTEYLVLSTFQVNCLMTVILPAQNLYLFTELFVPRHRRSMFGRRAFSVAGPAACNSLPDYLSRKTDGRLPLLPPGLQLPPQPLRGLLPVLLLGEQRHDGRDQLPKTVTRQRRGCDLNPGPSAPESSTPTTRLPRHP